MANSNSSGNSSVFRGLYSNSSTSTPSSNNIYYHNQLLNNHLHQHSSYNPANYSTVSNSSSGNNISTTPVSLPAPAPVPGKSGVSVKSTESSKHATNTDTQNSGNPDQMVTLVAKYYFEHNLESSLSTLERDEHEKRMHDLRKQLEYISETNWKYSPVDKYIGQL